MSNTNNAVLASLGINSGPFQVAIASAAVAGTQAAGTPIRGTAVRVLNGGTGASMVLPSMLSNEDFDDFIFVINDTATTVLVFCALGETMNGSTNGSLSIAAGATGIFISRQQIDYPYAAPDWRGVALT